MASIHTFKSGARYGYRVKGLIVHGTVQSFHGPAVHASHEEAQRAARREINQINHAGAQIRAAAPHPADYDNPRTGKRRSMLDRRSWSNAHALMMAAFHRSDAAALKAEGAEAQRPELRKAWAALRRAQSTRRARGAYLPNPRFTGPSYGDQANRGVPPAHHGYIRGMHGTAHELRRGATQLVPNTYSPNPRGNMATKRPPRRSAKDRAAYKGAKKDLSSGHWSYIAAVDPYGRNCLRLTVDGSKTDKYVYSPAMALAAVAKLSQGKQTMVSNPRSKKRSRRKSGHKGNVAALRTGMSMMKHAAALYRNGEVPSVAAGMKVLAAQARPNPKRKGKKKSGHKGNAGNLTKGQSLMKRAAAAYHAGEYTTMAAAMKGVSRGSARSNPYYRILR